MKLVVLIVLDGWGIAPSGPGNAISQAHLPYYHYLLANYPNGMLNASGEAVGLPRGEDGNTETGHLNLGAGRIVYQDLPRINMAIADGTFFQNIAFVAALSHVQKTGGNLHLMGLISSGGVHSNIEHLFALLEFCKEHSFIRVYLHLFTDGRDSPPSSAAVYLDQLKQRLNGLGVGKIATIMGRYFAMDRDRRWERTQQAYDTLTKGTGRLAKSAEEAITTGYAHGETDEFIKPTVIKEGDKPVSLIKDGDSVIFFNFRIDRPRQLTKAFVLDDFEHEANQFGFDPFAIKYFKKHEAVEPSPNPPFPRGPRIKDLFFVTMTEYSKDVNVSAVAYPPQRVLNPLGRVLSENNILQLRVSESEKERFVTFYFDGLLDKPFQGEDRLIIPSPKVPTYDLKPEMSAQLLTQQLIKEIRKEMYGFILVNFANPDMVAHTGDLKATIKACEIVDHYLSMVVQEVLNFHGSVLITADHGNAEELIDQATGNVDTEHSTAPVPFIAINEVYFNQLVNLSVGNLADVAPSILYLLRIAKPSSMTGRNLLDNVVDLH